MPPARGSCAKTDFKYMLLARESCAVPYTYTKKLKKRASNMFKSSTFFFPKFFKKVYVFQFLRAGS